MTRDVTEPDSEAEQEERPRARPMEVLPVNAQGRSMVALKDPLGLTDTVALQPKVFFIYSLCDGTRTLSEIQVLYTRKFGDLLFQGKLKEILDALDRQLLMEGERFDAFKQELAASYARETVRKASHAGASYPADPDDLIEFLQSSYGGGVRPGGELCGLIAPHIDFQRGGAVYGEAYRRLEPEMGERTFFLFGTAHTATRNPFVLTRKDFMTPLGVAENRTDIVDELSARLGERFLDDEIVHRSEHSLEFLVVWLQYLFRGCRHPLRIVPVLCSIPDDGPEPPSLREFLAAVREVAGARPGEFFYLAGADLSHVGPKFGDSYPPGPDTLAGVEEEDRKALAFVESADPDGFLDAVRGDGNPRHVCGLAPIFSVLSLAGAGRGEILAYEQCEDPVGSSAVTVCAAALYRS